MRFQRFTFLVFLCASFISVSVWAKNSSDFFIGGYGAHIPLVSILAKAFKNKSPGFKVKLLSDIGSLGAVRGVKDRRINLAVISRDLNSTEVSSDLVVVPFARTALVFIVSKNIAGLETNVSASDLVQIYSGKKDKWKNGESINVIIHEKGNRGAELLTDFIPELRQLFDDAWAKEVWRIEFTEKGMMETVNRVKNSFGWTDLSYSRTAKTKFNILKFNGIEANEGNILSGAYPFVRVVNFVYMEPLDPEMHRFIDFVKSAEGAQILRKYGAIPIR